MLCNIASIVTLLQQTVMRHCLITFLIFICRLSSQGALSVYTISDEDVDLPFGGGNPNAGDEIKRDSISSAGNNTFELQGTGLQNDKATKVSITFTCNENGKKVKFKATITKATS